MMSHVPPVMRRILCALAILPFLVFPSLKANAVSISILHSFKPGVVPDGPWSSLVEYQGNFYGTSENGAPGGLRQPQSLGTIYKVTPAGVVTVLHAFAQTDGTVPLRRLTLGNDGNFYGLAEGGPQGDGVAFKISPTGTFTLLHTFTSGEGFGFGGPLILGQDGNFYGCMATGGLNSGGTLYQMTPSGTVTTLHSFAAATDGSNPTGALVQDSSGNFYGAATYGGSGSDGTIFKIGTDNSFTVLHSFTYGDSNGRYPEGNMIIASDGKLYGYTQVGDPGVGSIFSCTTDGATFAKLYAFGTDGSDQPEGTLVEVSPLVFYGCANYSNGTHTKGEVFSFTASGTYTTIHQFLDTEGWYPEAGVVKGTDGTLWGTTTQGANVGSVFHVTTDGGTFSTVATFAYTEGGAPTSPVIKAASDGNYYGITNAGGTADRGSIYKLTSGGTFTSLHSLVPADGFLPVGGLVEGADALLYGVNPSGGGNYGDIFSISTAGTYSHVIDVDYTHGTNPKGTLILAGDGNLYGTTNGGGTYGQGSIYQLASGVLTDIHDFAGTDGNDARRGLTDGHDGFFYGVTHGGGANSAGTIFKVTSAGTFTTMHDFDGTNGSAPEGELIVGSDDDLYGTTSGGGANGFGTVFKISQDSPYTFTLLHSFTGVSDGSTPTGALMQDPADNVFYGTCSIGGSLGLGTIFSMTTDGTLSTVYDFDSTKGSLPLSGLYRVSHGNFIGTASAGGTYKSGTIYNIVMTPQTPTNLVLTPHHQSVDLAWDTVPGTVTYNVYRGTSPGGESSTAIATGLTSPAYHDSGLTDLTAYYYKVSAVNDVGEGGRSLEVHTTPTANTASFVTLDTTTQGNWKGVYGGDGWNVIGDTSANNPTYPGYATVTPGSRTTGVWAASSLSPNALQMAAVGSAGRMAGVWYQTSWSMNVNVTGSHKLALYLVDFNNAGYAETITVKDSVNGSILDSRTASGFGGGAYYVYNLSGAVTITFTSTAGHWAVLNGIFFGSTGPTAPDAPANFAVGAGIKRLKLSWTASPGATSYNVYRGAPSGSELSTPVATGVTGTSHIDTPLTPGLTYYYKVVAVNAVGGSFASSEASATVSTTNASFVKTDTTAQGNWKGAYGADGWNVIGDVAANQSTPGYATVTPGVHSSGVWASTSLAPNALQTAAAGSAGRTVGVWFQTSWSMNVNIASGTHQVALYLVDYNNAGYAETITVKDTATGDVIDSRSAASFAGGAYLAWNVTGNVTFTFTSTAGHWAVLNGIFFGGTGPKAPATPASVSAVGGTQKVTLSWAASTGAISYNVYRGGTAGAESTTPIATGATSPYVDNGRTPGATYYYKVVSVNAVGGSFASTEASATVPAPTSTVTFSGSDMSTQGNWKGAYGADGYNVIGDTSSPNPVYPGYATVTPGAHNSGIWAASSTSQNCLQKVATGSTDRMAGVWYQTSWSMNLTVTGSHLVQLYFVDFNNAGYAETVTFKDTATGAVLDTRPVSSFSGGVWESWTVNGNVTVTFTSTAGHWAVLNGIFFGTAS